MNFFGAQCVLAGKSAGVLLSTFVSGAGVAPIRAPTDTTNPEGDVAARKRLAGQGRRYP